MICPKCHHEHTKVYDTRLTKGGKATRRRRECLLCQHRFTTLEEVKILDLKVEKRSGQIVDFDSNRLESGIRSAYNKRPVEHSALTTLVQKAVDDILAQGKNPIKATKIGKIVLKHLREVDEAAYICYWAMFGNFETADEFNKLLKQFQKNK
jgi:transcriptional repressor NrdR